MDLHDLLQRESLQISVSLTNVGDSVTTQQWNAMIQQEWFRGVKGPRTCHGARLVAILVHGWCTSSYEHFSRKILFFHRATSKRSRRARENPAGRPSHRHHGTGVHDNTICNAICIANGAASAPKLTRWIFPFARPPTLFRADSEQTRDIAMILPQGAKWNRG
jgi:hypothetical protein